MKIRSLIIALALCVVFSGNAYAVVDTDLRETTFTDWTNTTTSATAFGVTLTGNWGLNTAQNLTGVGLSFGPSTTMTFNNPAKYFAVDYVNDFASTVWDIELSGTINDASDFYFEGLGEYSFVNNILRVVLPTSGYFAVMPESLFINSITLIGSDAGFAVSTLTNFAYAPTPIPGSVLLLLTSLAGMFGFRRFV